MNPFSIAAGVAGFLSLSGSRAQYLRRLIHNAKYAPHEILALSNEVSDINLVLSDIDSTNRIIGSSVQTEDLCNALPELLKTARSSVRKLEDLVAEVYTVLPNGRAKFQRYTWVRKRASAISLQHDLVNVKKSLSLLLSLVTTYGPRSVLVFMVHVIIEGFTP